MKVVKLYLIGVLLFLFSIALHSKNPLPKQTPVCILRTDSAIKEALTQIANKRDTVYIGNSSINIVQDIPEKKIWEYPVITTLLGAIVGFFSSYFIANKNNRRLDLIRREEKYEKNMDKLSDLKSTMLGLLLEVDTIVQGLYVHNFESHFNFIMKGKLEINTPAQLLFEKKFAESEKKYNEFFELWEDWKNRAFKPAQDLAALVGRNDELNGLMSGIFLIETNPFKTGLYNRVLMDYEAEKRMANDFFKEMFYIKLANPLLEHIRYITFPKPNNYNWLQKIYYYFFPKKTTIVEKLPKKEVEKPSTPA